MRRWPSCDCTDKEYEPRPILRFPAISEKHLAFVYAGDIWVADWNGNCCNNVRQLSSAPGQESGPRFSPDGQWIAFSADYAGSLDIYVISTQGGVPKRLTHHPGPDVLVDWIPDGIFDDGEGPWILFASQMETGLPQISQLYRISPQGGMPIKLPLSIAAYGAISKSGWLAFQTVSRVHSTWRRYRGGQAPEIYLWKIGAEVSPINLTKSDANDSHPIWSADGSKLYFLSDRGERREDQLHTLWVYDWEGKDPSFSPGGPRRVVPPQDAPIRNPSIGPGDIVFEIEGQIHRLALKSEEVCSIAVHLQTDQRFLRPQIEKVGNLIRSYEISPNGRRAVFEARGEIFTIPMSDNGIVRNHNQSFGEVAQRYPTWSPDGELIAYFTDRKGEYQLAVRPDDGSGKEYTLTEFDSGYRYRPFWSPDSKKIAFIDQTRHIHCCFLQRSPGTITLQGPPRPVPDQIEQLKHSDLEAFDISWSPCSRWLSYARKASNQYDAIFLYDTKEDRVNQVTQACYSNWNPVFDPEGQYLYFFTSRSFTPLGGDFDGSWIFANSTQIAAIPLRSDVPPLAFLISDETARAIGEEARSVAPNDDYPNLQQCSCKGIDPDDIKNFEARLQPLSTPRPGNYGILHAMKGRLLYLRRPNTGDSQSTVSILSLDLSQHKEQVFTQWTPIKSGDNATTLYDFALAARTPTLLVRQGRSFLPLVLSTQSNSESSRPLATDQLETVIDPAKEWQQVFEDAWRLLRDFFYTDVPKNWQERRAHYETLLKGATSRWDVDYLLDELAAELETSHATAEFENQRPTLKTGLLGAYFASHTDERPGFKISRILRGAPWDAEVRSPLAVANLAPGDRLLSINGVSASTASNPWQLLEGLAGKVVEIVVELHCGHRKSLLIRTLTPEEEGRLRYLEWLEERRLQVKNKDERIGYVHIPNVSHPGFAEFFRQFRSQIDRDGFIFDARFNSGGQDPYRFLELISRAIVGERGFRAGKPLQHPSISTYGPKVLLMNQWTSSYGEILAFGFRQLGLGDLLGSRTYGGTLGRGGTPGLIDGSTIVAPNIPIRDNQGNLVAEGPGLEGVVKVDDVPYVLNADPAPKDTQLEAAISHVLQQLKHS